MTKYEIQIDQTSNAKTILRFNEDGSVSYIPEDLANSDYQAYLADEASTK